jgi:WD40 repeat protein
MELSPEDWKYVDERAGSFVGRDWAFAEICGFLSGPTGTFLLRGDPGTGKTAVAARLAQASCGRAAADGVPPPVAEGTISAAVFCRAGKASVGELIQRLSDQLTLSVAGFGEARQAMAASRAGIGAIENVNVGVAGNVSPGGIVAGVYIQADDDKRAFDVALATPLRRLRTQATAPPIVLLVDAVDEAVAADQANTFSWKLGQLEGVHLIITCRPDRRVLADFRKADRTIDLLADAPSGDSDVLDYIRDRLRGQGPAAALTILIDRIAHEAAGNFLYAFHVTGTLVGSGSLGGLDEDAARTLPLPTGGLPGVYLDFLDRQIARDERRWKEEFRPVLAAVSAALGDGFTQTQLAAVASRLTGREFSLTEVRDVTREVGQFLDQPVRNGPFRVYHQSFMRFLADPEQNPDWSVDLGAANRAVVRALTDGVPERRPGEKEWAAADPYLRRHLAEHAARAGALDALVADPGFVLACDLSRLLTVIAAARTPEGRMAADVVVRAAPYLKPEAPDRASCLQMFARRYGAARFADRIGGSNTPALPWSTRWAHVTPSTPHRVLGTHDELATAVTGLVMPDGERVAVSGGADGVVRVWNLDPEGPAHVSLVTGTPVRSVISVPHSDGHPRVLVLDQAGTCAWWDLTDAPTVPIKLGGRRRCHCVAAVGGHAFLGCGSSTVIEYDLNHQRTVRTIHVPSSDRSEVKHLAVLPDPEGGGRLVVGLPDVAAVVDLSTGDTVGEFDIPGRLLAAAQADGRKVALMRGDRDIQLWDVDLRARIGYLMMNNVYGSGTMTDGTPVILATDRDGMFGAWDLSDLVASCSTQATAELTDLIRDALPELPAGPEEGSDGFAPEHLAQVISDVPASLGLGGPVRAIAAVARPDGRSATVAYAGPGDQRIWPAKPAPPDPGPGVFATDRGPLPRLAATAHTAINNNNDRIDTWVLPPPPGRGQRLLGHVGQVTGAAVADGDRALSVGADGTVRSWDLELGRDTPHGLVEQNERPSALVAVDSPDAGQLVITGGIDGLIRMWSVADGSPQGDPLIGNGYAIRSLAATETSKGLFVAALHQNRMLRLWNLATRTMEMQVVPVEAFTFTVTPDSGVAIAITSAFNTLEVYRVPGADLYGQITRLEDEQRGFLPRPMVSVRSPEGFKLIRADKGQLEMLDLESGEAGERGQIVLGEMEDPVALGLVAGQDKVACVVAITSSGIELWELRGKAPLTPRVLAVDDIPGGELPHLLTTGRLSNGDAVASFASAWDQKLWFLDPGSMVPFGVIAADSGIGALAIAADGTVIVAAEAGPLAITPPRRGG